MTNGFLLYGANGYVGEGTARLAVAQGLQPVLAGRNAARIEPLATELGLDFRGFRLDDPAALDRALSGMSFVLHMAGPYQHTWRPMVDACMRAGAHYLDINGEIPVLTEIAARDAEARARNVMLLPAVGFDVVPTDCLALHLKHRLPSATRLTLAFQVDASTAPPGTQRTGIELLPFGDRVRRDGRLIEPEAGASTRTIDFGRGPAEGLRVTWGDVFTAYHSTGIPNIEVYAAMPPRMRRQMELAMKLRPLLALRPMRALLKLGIRTGPGPADRAAAETHVWGEVTDGAGGIAVSRLHGPEAGHDWTARAALSVVHRVLAGAAPPGFQTPAGAYGPDLALDSQGVTREDVV